MARSKKVAAVAIVAAPAVADLSVSATQARIAEAAAAPYEPKVVAAPAVTRSVLASFVKVGALFVPPGAVPATPVAAAAPAVAASSAPVATGSPVTAKNVAYVLSALADGPRTVKSLAEEAKVTEGAIRNAIDNIRRARGKDAVVARGNSVFALPG